MPAVSIIYLFSTSTYHPTFNVPPPKYSLTPRHSNTVLDFITYVEFLSRSGQEIDLQYLSSPFID